MLPSAQHLLVRAAHGSDADVGAAWSEWKTRAHDLEEVPLALLPALYRNLTKAGIADADLPRCRGVYRRAWYENQRLLHDLHTAVTACRNAGVPVVLGAEAALLLTAADAAGARPLGQIGIVTAPEQALAAARALARNGWKPVEPFAGQATVRYSSAERFWNRAGRSLELRWRFCWEIESVSRRSTTPVLLQDTETPALGPTELLLHLLTCDFRPYAANPAPWVADALSLFQTSVAGFDWSRVAAAGRVPGLALPLRTRLGYLRQTWAAAIPEVVLYELDRRPATTTDRLHARLSGAAGGSRWLERALWHWRTHQQQTAGIGWWHCLRRLPRYLVHNLSFPGARWARRCCAN